MGLLLHGITVLACALSAVGCSSSTAATVSDAGAGPAPSNADPSGPTSLSGKLGALGALQPTVSSLWMSNSGETLIYLSSGPLTCDQLTVSRWLGSATKGSQVLEIVMQGAPKLGDIAVPPGEVNYAEGGKSSSYEMNADSGKLTITSADAKTLEGRVTATYADGSVVGTFHAEFCDNGQDY